MRSNYKQLGQYITSINIRNTEMSVETLLGVSVKKIFIPSIANTVGTDFKKYKIVKRNQFTYIPDTSRRGEKIGLAMLEDYDIALVSQAYTVFKIIDHNQLDPEYLMMWFRRPEFDRYARYKSHGSVREAFDWEEMCEVELPIPSIEKQRAIVKEYNTVVNRIKLNEELNRKLEETAQAIYKEWFVDFNFPITEESCPELASGSPHLIGKPYKSSGGEMVWDDELDKEVPEGWNKIYLEDIIEIHDSKRIPLSGSERVHMLKLYPYYGAASLMDYVEDYLFDGTYILLGEDGSVVNKNGTPILQYVWGKFWVNNHAHILKAKRGFSEDSLYMLLANTNVTDIITGGVQAKISQTNLKSVLTIYPDEYTLKSFNLMLAPIFYYKKSVLESILKLNSLEEILLSKMSKVDLEKELL